MTEAPFKLHPDFGAWIDRESLRISGLVQDLSHKASAGNVLPKETGLPIAATFGPDDIKGTPIVSQEQRVSNELRAAGEN
jgi:hypothetical protein